MRSLSGSVAKAMSAWMYRPRSRVIFMVSGFSGFGLSTVGKRPSMTICCSASSMYGCIGSDRVRAQ